MLTYLRKYCSIRPPWFSRGQGLPRAPSDCQDPVLEINAQGTRRSISCLIHACARAKCSLLVPRRNPVPPSSNRQLRLPGLRQAAATTKPASARQTLRSKCHSESGAQYFQEATQMDPNRSDAWSEIGNANLALDRYVEATLMWDKVLNLGGPLTFGACHRRSSNPACPATSLLELKRSRLLPPMGRSFSLRRLLV